MENSAQTASASLPQELRINGQVRLQEVILRKPQKPSPPSVQESDLVEYFKSLSMPYHPGSMEWLIDNQFISMEGDRLFPTQLGIKVGRLCLEQAPELSRDEIHMQIERDLQYVSLGRREYRTIVQKAVKMIQSAASADTELKIGSSSNQCPLCGAGLVPRKGKYGLFTACSRYPACHYTQSPSTQIPCLKNGCNGEVVERRSKNGRLFYGCSRYPLCDFVSWKKPVSQ
jgi:DNA topoisomerase-1